MPDRTRLRSAVPAPDLGHATRHARPVAVRHPIGAGRAELPTDPHGFPPIPARPPAAPPPDALEAAALAAAFAADYLSWDEDDPARRGRVLAAYLAAPVRDPARLGWAGGGRQRAEFALPGAVRPGGADRVLVDVRVRVTPYRKVGNREPDAAAPDEPEVPGLPAAAPAPTGPGWRACASSWIRLIVPVVRAADRLAVEALEDTAEDTTGHTTEDTPTGTTDGTDGTPRALRDGPVTDDPLAEPLRTLDGAW
jgi:hypothetical protein